MRFRLASASSRSNPAAVGNPYCWGGLRLDAETGLQNDDGGDYLETASGRDVNGCVWCWGDNRSGMIGNNPWSGGSALKWQLTIRVQRVEMK